MDQETTKTLYQGRVTKKIPERGYGFIYSDEYGVVFFHYTEIRGTSFTKLQEGALVEFEVRRSSKNYEALEVTVIENGKEPESAALHKETVEENEGLIVTLNQEKKYGFIYLNGSKSVYFNRDAVVGTDFRDLREGQKVSFYLVTYAGSDVVKQRKAIGVRVKE